jgi:hypothetical protein
MPALVAGIHVFGLRSNPQRVDGRDIGERNDAVLRTAMPGHDATRAKRPALAAASALWFSCASWFSWRHRPRDAIGRRKRCRSSVVEHSLGKGEVVSSILTGSTINLCQ